MTLLSKNELATIERQMYNKGRDIDVALYNYITGQMPNEFVGYALPMYQNKDGGFGHGLHNDNLNPNSTVFQTLEALRYICLSSLDLENEDNKQMLKRIFNYLYNKKSEYSTYDEGNLAFACAEAYRNKLLAVNLLPEVLGRTIALLDEKSPYFRKSLVLLPKVDNDLLKRDSLSFIELQGYHVLYDALEKKGLEFNQEAYYYYIKLRNNYIENLKINSTNYFEILELLDDKFAYSDKIDEALKKMKEELKPHGLYEATTSWDNNYPEGESAKLKWLGTRTVFNIILFNKFQEIEE